MNCSNCQTVNPDEAKFCMNCGTRLTMAVPATGVGEIESQARIQALDKFIPPELMTKFQAARTHDAMTGERRVITMLFCDVKGSTAAAEKLDPEIWSEIMNGIFEYMIRPVYRYEGTVPRLMGDAILAFFGAPIAHEDDPQRAILAGLEIQSGIKDYAENIRTKYGLEFSLRVGINTGLVVVGAIGSDLRMEYTAIGDAINLAARMEQTAAPGTVQISADTYRLAAPFFEFEALGEVEVKGKTAPIKTYRPLNVIKNPGRLRGLEGLSSPLVGREAQLSVFKECLSQLDQGAGSFLAVTGEAGLGKSSLAAEVQKSNDISRFHWLRGTAISYSRSISYYLWRQIIRQSIDARESDSPADVRKKLGDFCKSRALSPEEIPFLEVILAIESETSLREVLAYQGEALVEQISLAARSFLSALAREKGLTLLFDDLHWADDASLDLLLNLADLSNSQPLVFICLLRPDITSAGWNAINEIEAKAGMNFHAITLEPLPPDQTDLLLTNLLGAKDLPVSLKGLIVTKAGGNPFFIEELIRSLIETGQLIRDGSHWQVIKEVAKLSLPDTLRGVLSARIDRLPETTRHILQTASVIGRSFELRVLERLINSEGNLGSHIQKLKEAGLIQAGENNIQDEYAFRHVLIQDAAYDSILIKTRLELHRQIGETLEKLHSERIEELTPLLAYHFYFAQDLRSLKYDLLAGEKAARLYANAEAATHFNRALEVAKHNNSDVKQITKLYSQLGGVLELSGHYEQALQNYDEMQAFGHKSGARTSEMAALMAKATIYSIFTRMHNSLLSEQMLIEALEISHEIGDRTAQARLNWNLMLNSLFSKRPDQALEYGQLALSLARESDDREQLAYVLNDLCRLYTCRGEFEKAYEVIKEARELWRALDNQVMLADSLGSEAEARFNAGEFDRALECSQEALQISEKIENLWGQSYDRMLMAFVYIETGELGTGIQFAAESIKLADEAGLIASSIGMRSELAWLYAYCGAVEIGDAMIEKALQVADAKQPAWKAFPQAGQIRMQLLRGDVLSAGDTFFQPISIPYARYTIFLCLANIELAILRGGYNQGLALIEELLNEVSPLTRVDIPDVLRWKAEAFSGLGRLEEAYQTLAQACSMSEKLGAKLQIWPILASLAEVCSKLGKYSEAESHLEDARRIVGQIADSLREVGLRESFLSQPRVQALIS